jgi:hypothetical protein
VIKVITAALISEKDTDSYPNFQQEALSWSAVFILIIQILDGSDVASHSV